MARDFAQQHGLHLVLKGHRTVYASPSGQVFVNCTGNPGMATGGSGDVLAGVLAGLLGQARFLLPSDDPAPTPNGTGPSDASSSRLEEVIALGVYLHGLAGDLVRGARREVARCLGYHGVPAGGVSAARSNEPYRAMIRFGTTISRSVQETFDLAKSLGESLTHPAIFFLEGNPGAGKTVFAKGLICGLGHLTLRLPSPSFTLIMNTSFA